MFRVSIPLKIYGNSFCKYVSKLHMLSNQPISYNRSPSGPPFLSPARSTAIGLGGTVSIAGETDWRPFGNDLEHHVETSG